MKRFLCLALILSASLLHIRAFALEAPETPEIISETAVLMDAETGQVLYQKNPEKRMYPASTTKIMTGLLTVENCSPDETARTSGTAIDIKEWDSANIALQENEEMSVDSLMYAMLLRSANDASNVLAEHIAGGQDNFAAMMNGRAKSIGAESTHFANAHGLHDPNHYTTAYDLALITREAIGNKTFMRYFGAPNRTVPATNLNPYERRFTNYQYMLVDTTDYYDPGVIGGKVGYTYEAEHTMSTVAEKNGRRLICVVMKSPSRGNKFEDTKKLMNFGFGEFREINVGRERFPGFEERIIHGENEIGIVTFRSTSDFKVLLHMSLEPSEVKVSYSSLKASDGREGEAYAEFQIDTRSGAVPSLLGRASLERSVAMYPPADPAALFSRLVTVIKERPWILPLAIFFVVLSGYLAFLSAKKVSVSVSEKRRQKMLEEIQAAEEARYKGPIPVVGKQFLIK